jgi:hypothetical protein
MTRTAWTREEDRLLREHFPHTKRIAALLTLFPGRSHYSIRDHAYELGLRTRRGWTRAELRALREGWHELGPRGLRRALPGRTWSSIRQKADDLGLPSGVPQGCESLAACAARTGFHHSTLARILEAGGVRVRVTYPRGKPGCQRQPRHYVERDAADEAVARFLETETVVEAARRRGLHPSTLADWLGDAGELRPERRHGRLWRVPGAVIDRVAAERRAALAAWRASRKRAA